MILKQRYEIKDLPVIAKGSQFILGDRYAKIENGTLWLCHYKSIKLEEFWMDTEKTLEEYNNYYIKEVKEYNIKEILAHGIKTIYTGSFSGINHDTYYIFKDWDETYKVSYIKPIIKGTKGMNNRIRYGAGETMSLCGFTYPQLEELVGDNVVVVHMCDSEVKSKHHQKI